MAPPREQLRFVCRFGQRKRKRKTCVFWSAGKSTLAASSIYRHSPKWLVSSSPSTRQPSGETEPLARNLSGHLNMSHQSSSLIESVAVAAAEFTRIALRGERNAWRSALELVALEARKQSCRSELANCGRRLQTAQKSTRRARGAHTQSGCAAGAAALV